MEGKQIVSNRYELEENAAAAERKTRFSTRMLALGAIVGAAYAALTMFLAPISYGAVQFRISEVLCILPYFIPGTAWGLFVGCAIANILGGGVLDIVFGSLATLGAALATAWFGKREHTVANSLLACLMPVVFNAVIVGAVVTAVFTVEGETINPFTHWSIYLSTAASVGFGEAVVLYVLGFPLVRWLPKQRFFQNFLDKFKS